MRVLAISLRTVAAAGIATLAIPAMALTQANLTLSDFSYTLKDVNPSDSVTPALVWVASTFVNGFSNDQQQAGWTQNGSYLQAKWQPPLGNNSWDSTQTSLSSPLNLGQLAVSTQGAGPGSLSVSTSLTAGFQNSTSATFGQQFELSAGSQVTFRYVINGSLSGTGSTGLWEQPAGIYALDWQSSANYGVSMVAGAVSSQFGGNGSSDWTDRTDAYESIVDGQILQLTLSNNSNATQVYQFYANANVYANEVTAPIPEPTSYALMVLGLLAVGGAVKRRR